MPLTCVSFVDEYSVLCGAVGKSYVPGLGAAFILVRDKPWASAFDTYGFYNDMSIMSPGLRIASTTEVKLLGRHYATRPVRFRSRSNRIRGRTPEDPGKYGS